MLIELHENSQDVSTRDRARDEAHDVHVPAVTSQANNQLTLHVTRQQVKVRTYSQTGIFLHFGPERFVGKSTSDIAMR